MRKDFLVDPYQVIEARAAGAGGVLVIVRMLPRAGFPSCWRRRPSTDCSCCWRRSTRPTSRWRESSSTLDGRRARRTVLLGVNCRDLATLKVVPRRFAALAPRLPAHWAAVAESGVATPSDACEMRRLGYRLALIGTALMQSDDPRVLLAEILSMRRAQHRPKWLHFPTCGSRFAASPEPTRIAAAAAAKVDAIGFVFAPSPRQVTPGQAGQLAALVPPGILRIAVAQHPLADESGRDLPHPQAGLLSDRRRGSARAEDSAHIKVLPVVRFGRKTPSPLPPRIVFEGPPAASARWPTGAGRRSLRGRPR